MAINKKFLQFVAATWILIFHLWISLSGTRAEMYLVRIGYVGVDLFFFLSAYSLANRAIDYKSFLKNRFGSIYIRFLLFAVFAAIYKSWSALRLLQVVTTAEFFTLGGGSFLWFLPAIMLFYILFPLFLQAKGKWKGLWVLLGWLILSFILAYGLGYTQVFIFTNRIPVILLGYLAGKNCEKKWNPALMLGCFAVGLVLLYFFGFQRKLSMPFADFYFVLAIPVVVGLAGLSTYIPSAKWMKLLGDATLEVYALQMIVGTTIVTQLHRILGSKWLTNLFMLIVLYGLAVALHFVWTRVIMRLANH